MQVIPHVTDEIINRIKNINKPKRYDVVICEVGGTVGDIESLPFMKQYGNFHYRLVITTI